MTNRITCVFRSLLIVLSLSACVPQVTQPTVVTRDQIGEGLGLLAVRKFDAAWIAFSKFAAQNSDNPAALMGYAIASDMTGRVKASARAYEKLLTMGRDQAVVFNNVGYSYMLRGELTKAMPYLLEAERRDPRNKTIKNNLKMLRKAIPVQ